MKNEKKRMTKFERGLFVVNLVLTSILGLVLTVIFACNGLKLAVYPEFYNVRETVCTNHGLNENFVSQGTAVTDDGKYVITSGYMSDKTNSRIYITEVETDETHYVNLSYEDEKPVKLHLGGVAVEDDTIYLVSKSTVYTLSLEQSLQNDEMQINKLMEVNNNASYVFSDDDYLYVGEFYRGSSHKTNTSIKHNDKTYKAIVEKYDFDDLSKPVAVYAVRNQVQGFAMNEEGDVVLSTSYGLNSSYFYYYESTSVIDTGTQYLEAPLYVLETEDCTLKGPAMSEDLDYYNGRFYTNFELSSNKYIFGKFFINSNKIVAIDFTNLLA